MNIPIRIAICEDNIDQLHINQTYIEYWASLKGVKVEISSYQNAESFLFHWNGIKHYDIIFLDILMKKMSGIECAKYIRQKDEDVAIIFITGGDSYVFEGYKVQALDYLMKPISKKNVVETLNRWYEKYSRKEALYYLVKRGKELIKVNSDDIYYFISFDHYIDIHTVDDVLTFKEKISQVESELPNPQFCRCHRSYIVNLKCIDVINKNEIVLDNGVRIPVSKSRLKEVYESFITYFKNNR